MTTFAEALVEGRAALAAADPGGAAREARMLLSHASGLDAAALIARSAEHVSTDTARIFADALSRRVRGVPVARILGEAEFYGLRFTLSAATLVPRQDTETLVEVALAEARRGDGAVTLCDLGTGSGAVVVTLLANLPHARAVATDIAEDALATARANAERHGVAERVAFRRVAFADGPDGLFDIVVSNPPYIRSGDIASLAREVREHDPHAALDGGPDGLDRCRAICARAPLLLTPGGLLALEVGYDQAGAVAALMRESGLAEAAPHPDLQGRDRVVAARFLPIQAEDGAKKPLGKPG